MDLTFKSAQNKVDDWISSQDVTYWPPLSMLASIMEEVGEISRIVNRIDGLKVAKPGSEPKGLEEEIGDLMFSLICLSNYFDIDLESSLESTLKKYMDRDRERWKKIKNAGE